MGREEKVMKKAIKITSQGKKELEKEMSELKSRRGAIADKIAAARDFGDLSENAEYDVAREEQGLVETRIKEIEDILATAIVIKSGGKTKIAVGSTVELKSKKGTFTYTLVGPVEADPLQGRISDVSPIGKALNGKKVGDVVQITTPKGSTDYEIVSIS